MKKFLFASFILLSLLVIPVGTVFAGSVVDLIGTSNGGGGPTFTFRVSGEFSQSQLNDGFVQVQGGDSFPLSCNQTDETTVICHTTKKASGQSVVVSFGGVRFWVDVPEENLVKQCEPIYDLDQSLGPLAWAAFGQVCTNQPAVFGDTFVTFNPFVGISNWTYFFLYSAPSGFQNNPGHGYYPIE